MRPGGPRPPERPEESPNPEEIEREIGNLIDNLTRDIEKVSSWFKESNFRFDCIISYTPKIYKYLAYHSFR